MASDLEMAVKHMAQHIAERSNPAGPAAPSGVVEMRRMAMAKGMEPGRTGDGNKESNLHGSAPSNKKRKGNVKAPAKRPPSENKPAAEGRPAYAQERIGGFAGAGEKARRLHRES